ncbi:tryptophan synthase subunit alpha [Streptomyces sp. NPDC048508]|uniref:tryptophan synthase subunit alpha n=1 Tax=Streptomyces sp. NPDC048508 TaxID=3365561 RepID=UPI003711546A
MGQRSKKHSDIAVAGGFRMNDLLGAAGKLVSNDSTIPVVTSYWQPLHAHGFHRFAEQAASSGASGVLIPDLPIEGAGAWSSAAHSVGVPVIYLVSLHSQPGRLPRTVATATGMVHAAATGGITGKEPPGRAHLPSLITQLRSLTNLPVAAGIGASTPATARTVAEWADLVVVGSADIRCMQSTPHGPDEAAGAACRAFAEALSPANPRPRADEDR